MNKEPLLPRHSFAYDGARIVVYHANIGEGLPMHKHKYSHAIMCNSGSCLVTLETGESVVMNKLTQPINLLAEIEHEIEAIDDGTVFANIFANNKY